MGKARAAVTEESHEDLYVAKRKFKSHIRDKQILLPEQLNDYFHYCSKLRLRDEPDYNHLRCLFMDMIFSEGVEFDWEVDWEEVSMDDDNLDTDDDNWEWSDCQYQQDEPDQASLSVVLEVLAPVSL